MVHSGGSKAAARWQTTRQDSYRHTYVVVKQLSCMWIMSGYDHMRSSPEIIRNGLKKAGIISAIEDGVE